MDNITPFYKKLDLSQSYHLLPGDALSQIEDTSQNPTQIQPSLYHPSSRSFFHDGLSRSTSTLSEGSDDNSQTTQIQESATPKRFKGKLL